MTKRQILAVVATLAAVTVAVALLWRSTTTSPAPDTAPQDPRSVVVLDGDRVTKPQRVALTEPCAAFVAPVRTLVVEHKYFAELDLAEVQQWLDVTNELHQACTPEELPQLRSELDAWRALIAPTYQADTPAVLSDACAQALAPTRATLSSGLDAAEPAFQALVAQAEEALRASCTEAEAVLFRLAEIEPPLRRAGQIASSQNATPQTTVPAAPVVVVVEPTAALSEGCAEALAPARRIIADAAGKPSNEAVRDELSSAVSSALGACTPAEIEEFSRRESSPALGLTPLTGG